MATTIASTLWVCTDCIVMLANGDEPADMDTEQLVSFYGRHRGGIERETGGYGNVVPGGPCPVNDGREHDQHDDDECQRDAFSRYPCNLCQSPLAGERHLASVIRP